MWYGFLLFKKVISDINFKAIGIKALKNTTQFVIANFWQEHFIIKKTKWNGIYAKFYLTLI